MADLSLSIQVEQWKREDELFLHLQDLLRSYRVGDSLSPDQIMVTQMHPGLCRIEPAFSKHAKSVPAPLKERFLARGRDEMARFTSFLEDRYFQQAEQSEHTEIEREQPVSAAILRKAYLLFL
jgi:hypothetical protein